MGSATSPTTSPAASSKPEDSDPNYTLNYEEPVIARSFLYPGFTVLVFAVLLGKKTLIVTIFLAKVSFVLISVFAV